MQDHAHRFVLPSPDGSPILQGVCACGAVKDHPANPDQYSNNIPAREWGVIRSDINYRLRMAFQCSGSGNIPEMGYA